MVLAKLVKVGAVVLTGSLLGGLATYNSEKTGIVQGINDIKGIAIEAKQNVVNLKQNVTTLETEKGKLQTSLTEEQEKATGLKADLEAKIVELNNAILERDSFKASSETNEAEVTRLNGVVESLTVEKNNLQTSYNTSLETIKTLETSIASKDKEIVKLNDIIKIKDLAAQDMYDNWGREVTDLKYQIEIKDLAAQDMYDNWGREVTKLKGEISELNKSIATLTADLDSVTELLGVEQGKNIELTNKKVELEGKIKELEDQKTAYAAEIVGLQKDVSYWQGEYQMLKEEKDTVDGLLNNANDEINGLKDESKNIVNKANEEINEANTDQSDIMDAIDQAKEEINAVE